MPKLKKYSAKEINLVSYCWDLNRISEYLKKHKKRKVDVLWIAKRKDIKRVDKLWVLFRAAYGLAPEPVEKIILKRISSKNGMNHSVWGYVNSNPSEAKRIMTLAVKLLEEYRKEK